MLTMPTTIERAEQPYLASRFRTTIAEFQAAIPVNIHRLVDGLAARGLKAEGPMFFRYHVIDMARLMEIDIALPMPSKLPGDDILVADAVPAGRYIDASYWGHYDGLYDFNAMVIGWTKERGLRLDVTPTPDGDRFGGRVEIYHTDMMREPDPAKWHTELAIRLAES